MSSRKHMLEKHCVRCGRLGPTPYLKKQLEPILLGKKSWAIVHDSKLRCVLQKGSI